MARCHAPTFHFLGSWHDAKPSLFILPALARCHDVISYHPEEHRRFGNRRTQTGDAISESRFFVLKTIGIRYDLSLLSLGEKNPLSR